MNVPYSLPTEQPYTPDQVKELFSASGIAVSTWAKANGYHPTYVYLVMNGQIKGNRGRGHEIAVKLGLKIPLDAGHPQAASRSAYSVA